MIQILQGCEKWYASFPLRTHGTDIKPALLKVPRHRDDPQAKAPASKILTIACQEFAGNMRKARQCDKALQPFALVPSKSRRAAGYTA